MPDDPSHTKITFNFKSAPTVVDFLKCDDPVRGIMGPYGSGKSTGCVAEIFRRGTMQAPSRRDGVRRTRWALIRGTYRELQDTTIKTVLDWFPEGLLGTWRKADLTYTITGVPGLEIELLFRAIDDPGDVKKLLSLDLTGAWINEAREVDRAVISPLFGRTGRYPAEKDGGCTWRGLIMDTNPPDTDSWWYDLFEVKKPEGWRLFKQPSGLSLEAENLPNLRKGYYTDQLMAATNEDWVKVHLKGEYGFVLDGKLVFPEFNDRLHVGQPKTIPTEEIIRSYDFGLTPACVFSQVLPTGQWVIVDELAATDMGIDRFSDAVLEHSSQNYPGRYFRDIGDPAGGQRSQTDERTCFEIMRSKGIEIEPGLQTLSLRLESIRKPLATLVAGAPQFLMHDRCKALRKAFLGGYHYKKRKGMQGVYDPTPEKNQHSHIMDALSYAATRIFGEGLTMPKPSYRDEDEDFTFTYAAGRSDVTGY